MENKYHRAARDGYLEALKPISKKECNQGDENGMTPTLWAAFEGNLEAIRFLMGKGGDPERTDFFGNTSLHLAAAKGHREVVSFLVNFGVNLWALDIDLHTARELAGMNDQVEILEFLDSIVTKMELESPAKVKKLKDKAQKAAQKLIKNYQKCQIQNVIPASNDELIKNVGNSTKKKSSTQSPLTYSEMTGTLSMERKPSGSSSIILRKLQRYSKVSPPSWNQDGSQFKIRSKEDDGTLKVTNLSGYKRDSEIIFVTPSSSTYSEVPCSENKFKQIPKRKEIAGIFERPGFGSVSFRNSVSASLFSFPLTTLEEGSIGSAGSFAERIDFDESSLEEEGSRELEDIDVLLTSLGLSEFSSLFHRERVDLEALYLLSEEDLKSMNIPIGPRRKLLKAISERKDDIQQSIVIEDSSL